MDLSVATDATVLSGATSPISIGANDNPIAKTGPSQFSAKQLHKVKLDAFEDTLREGLRSKALKKGDRAALRSVLDRLSDTLTFDLVNDDRTDLLLTRSTVAKLSDRKESDDRTDAKKHSSKEPADPLTGIRKNQEWVGAAELDIAGIEPSSTIRSAAAKPFPGRLMRYTPGQSLMQGEGIRQWQAQMRKRGWTIDVDGFYGPQSARVARQFQAEKDLLVDGIVGKQTWDAAFNLPTTSTPPPGNGGAGEYLNQRGLNLIKDFEGLRLTAYRDPVGIWTIGYGHTGPEVGPGDRITTAQAEALLKQDLTRFESAVRRLATVPLNSNQFSALVSFTYNVGTGALSSSTLLRRLNQRDYQGAANQFERWVYGGGEQLPGLVRRRAAEKALFLTPV